MAVRFAGPPLLFGLRLWASVCLALYVAFWLELDDPFWAGTSAAIVCQPQLGASLRKGWFRMIGTVVGAIMIVALTACFPQDRIAFLGLLGLWGGVCAFAATVLRNFASYAAALAGVTAALIGADTLGATGGVSPEVFWLAIHRASEISIGIVCAGIVLAGTDLGGGQRRLAASLAALAAEIAGRFTRMLALAGLQLPDTQTERRELARRVIALDPMIDQAIGESSQLRYHLPILQTAVQGLFGALNAWWEVAAHLSRLPADVARPEVETILRSLPAELRSASEPNAPTSWMADPMALRSVYDGAVRKLLALPVGTPSGRLLADETAKLLAGILRVLDGVALLVEAAGRPLPARRGFRLSVPDWLPALVNAGRAFVAIAAVEVFWVVSAWPNGAAAIVFVAIVLLLLSPKGDQAYAGAMTFMVGTAMSVLFAATIKFAVLPGLETFPAFCAAIGLVLIPTGFGMTQTVKPALAPVFMPMTAMFIPLLMPTNQMSYDTAQYCNSAVAIFAGCAAALLSLRLLPPVSPAVRTRRLLALSLRDLRRLAVEPLSTPQDWEGRMYSRLSALPDQAEPFQRAQLMAVHSIGAEIIALREMAPSLGIIPGLEAALKTFAHGNGALAITRLGELDRGLDSHPQTPPSAIALRARARLLAISDLLAEHSSYFDAGASA